MVAPDLPIGDRVRHYRRRISFGRPMARQLMLGLIRRARAMHARQAEAFAERLGVF